MNASAAIYNKLELSGGIIRAKELSSRQYHILLDMVTAGSINRIGRGLYATDEALANTIYDVDKLIPGGIVCAFTAWAFYGLTTQIPTTLCVAVARGRKITLPDYPPITLYHQSAQQLQIGKSIAAINGKEIEIFDMERSVCDAIKYRNKIGMDVCSEILKAYLKKPERNLNKLSQYARKLRVGTSLHKYLEILL